ncbi:MAG: hypothetical protein HOC27_05905 [Phycisphaerae bacterium]|jgi:hypothetical protein|nr:hypothetical protein [Phycisphaerae bacterium]
MLRAFQFALLILGVLSQFGCSTITVEVESTRRSDLVGISDVGTVYQLLPSQWVKTNYKYDKFASQVEYVLNGLGYVPVSETGQDNPELLIELSYGISDPIKIEFTYQLQDRGGGICKSCMQMVCYCGPMGERMSYQWRFARTGYRNEYRSELKLTANYVGSNNPEPAWETSATSSVRSDDLNSLFPFLLVASEAYIWTDAREKVEIRSNDSKVQKLLDL